MAHCFLVSSARLIDSHKLALGTWLCYDQVEVHPFWRNDELITYCNDRGIHVTAYCPLGMPWTSGKAVIRRADPASQHPVILEVAKKYNKHVLHIIMRWGLQHGTSIIAKSTNPCRIKVRNCFPSWLVTCTY